MTNLTDNPVYEAGIYQLETTDPVLGGPPGFNLGNPVTGHANAQAQQLANRTAYLKQFKDDIENGTDPTKGAGMVGWERSALYDEISTVSRMLNAQEVNIWEYSHLVTSKPTPSNPATWDWYPALVAAEAYVFAQGGGVIYIPEGDYRTSNEINLRQGVQLQGDGSRVTKLIRTANTRVVFVNGPAYIGTPETLPWYGMNVFGIAFNSDGNFSAPLVELKGVTASEYKDVTFSANTCSLLILHQVWDSRFNFVKFFEGGLADGSVPSLLLKGGYGYRATKEIFFHQCWFESYAGKAVDVDTDDNAQKPLVIGFSQIKFESRATEIEHVDLRNASYLMFDEFFITTYKTAPPKNVIELGDGEGYSGNMNFFFSVDGGTVYPQALVGISNAAHGKLDIVVPSNIPSNIDVITWDVVNPSTIDVDIHGPNARVNGRYIMSRNIKASSVIQSGLSADSVQYVWNKTGRVSWSWGNPANPSSTLEEFYLKGGSTNFLTARSGTNDPSTAFRSLVPGAHMLFGSAFNATNQLRIGNLAFWLDSQSRLRRTTAAGETYPGSELSGFHFSTNAAGTTASRPASPDIGQIFYDTSLGLPIWWNGAGWKDAAGNTV